MAPLSFTSLSLWSSVAACLGLSCSFVLSLYMADVGLPRDHPRTIKRRITAVSIVTLCSPLVLLFLSDSFSFHRLLPTLGIQLHGLLPAILAPLGLVLLLYIGPILQNLTSGEEWGNPLYDRHDIMIRNYIVAPIAEEIVFRSCMLPLMRPHLGDTPSILITPLFFGIAHVHHMIEHLTRGTLTFKASLLNVLLQTTYTSIFGIFSAYLFIRTGHMTSAILAHSLCNYMGLPEMWTIHRHRYRYMVGMAYVGGLIGFMYFLPKWTQPSLYYY